MTTQREPGDAGRSSDGTSATGACRRPGDSVSMLDIHLVDCAHVRSRRRPQAHPSRKADDLFGAVRPTVGRSQHFPIGRANRSASTGDVTPSADAPPSGDAPFAQARTGGRRPGPHRRVWPLAVTMVASTSATPSTRARAGGRQRSASPSRHAGPTQFRWPGQHHPEPRQAAGRARPADVGPRGVRVRPVLVAAAGRRSFPSRTSRPSPTSVST